MRAQFKPARCLLLAAAALLAGWRHPAAAQSHAATPTDAPFAAQHRRAVAANPPDLSLTLRVASSTSRFRQGEVIPLEIAFASSSPGRYQLDKAAYDGSGRLESDEIYLDRPTGAADPLWEYFSSQGGWFGGGLRAVSILDERPQQLMLQLNEWVRFDRPGTFRLYVTSHRVSDGRETNEGGFSGAPVSVSSNLVELTIAAADAGWSGRVLAQAVHTLDAKTDDKARLEACRTLRFLGSSAAVREMARRYDPDDRECRFELMFGLIGSPARRVAIAAMERQLDAPGGLVDDWFLRNLALLAANRAGSAAVSPAGFGRTPRFLPPGQSRLLQQRMDRALRQYAARLLAAIPRKAGRAMPVGLWTLLDLTGTQMGRAPIVAPELGEPLRRQIAAVFSALAADQQHLLLSIRWATVRGPAMIPVLRRIYEAPPPLPWLGGESLQTLALRRLHELAPDEATPLLLQEAQRPVPRVGPEALGLLPDEAAANLEQVIVGHLEEIGPSMAGMSEISFLVARYATPAMLPRVRAYYANQLNRGMCLQPPFIAYFLRVDPALGSAKLRELLDTPPQEDHPVCFRAVLEEVGKLFYSPELEEIAIAHLDDSDLDVAIDAAKVLGSHGSPAAEAPLWRRLERWHAKWQGRERELREAADYREASLLEALRQALARSPSWLADRAQLERLRDLGSGPNEGKAWLQNLLGPDENGRVWLSSYVLGDGKRLFTVAQYTLPSLAELEAKLAQFPAGTAFVWLQEMCAADSREEETQLRAGLAAFLEARGMILDR